MAEHMGAKRGLKQKSQLPEECMLNACSSGVVKGGCSCAHNDPYVSGERSSKHLKLDAQSSEANTHARAKATQSVSVPMPDMAPFATHAFVPPFASIPAFPSTVPGPPFMQPGPAFLPLAFTFTFTQPLPTHF